MNNQTAQDNAGQAKTAAGQNEHGVLETTAQAIGSTLGNLAVKAGIAKRPEPIEHSEPQATSRSGQHNGARHGRKSRKKK